MPRKVYFFPGISPFELCGMLWFERLNDVLVLSGFMAAFFSRELSFGLLSRWFSVGGIT
jgi:hypothetical protein